MKLVSTVSALSLLVLASFGAELFRVNESRADGPRADGRLAVRELPAIPNPLGVAGPVAGAHETEGGSVLIVAGGANFPRPVWETEKQWLSEAYVLRQTPDDSAPKWLACKPFASTACVRKLRVHQGSGDRRRREQ